MTNFVRRGILGLLLVALTAAVDAQAELKVTPAVPVPGSTVTVEYSDSSKAGQTVTVTINDNTYPTPRTDSVTITLGADGKGSAPWVVPQWIVAIFNAPDAEQVTVFIDGPDDWAARTRFGF